MLQLLSAKAFFAVLRWLAACTIRWCVSQSIIQAYRKAGLLAVAKARELSIDIATDDPAAQRDMLVRCAMTSMNSKLVRAPLAAQLGLVNVLTGMVLCVDGSEVEEFPSFVTAVHLPLTAVTHAESENRGCCDDVSYSKLASTVTAVGS